MALYSIQYIFHIVGCLNDITVLPNRMFCNEFKKKKIEKYRIECHMDVKILNNNKIAWEEEKKIILLIALGCFAI